jgi:hypothetical protein
LRGKEIDFTDFPAEKQLSQIVSADRGRENAVAPFLGDAARQIRDSVELGARDIAVKDLHSGKQDSQSKPERSTSGIFLPTIIVHKWDKQATRSNSEHGDQTSKFVIKVNEASHDFESCCEIRCRGESVSDGNRYDGWRVESPENMCGGLASRAEREWRRVRGVRLDRGPERHAKSRASESKVTTGSGG